jgi:hypothetical protein
LSGIYKKNYIPATVPAQGIAKELIVNFISVLGFDEQGF